MPRSSNHRTTLLCALTFAALALLAPAADAAVIRSTAFLDDNADNGNCTLREAVISANTDVGDDGCAAGSGSDTIQLRAGIYELSQGPAGEDAAASGDLDLTDTVKITGAERGTRIDANSIDRVFDVRAGAATFAPLAISGGRVAGAGGGIRVASGAVANVIETRIAGNFAFAGGGIEVGPNATANVQESVVSENSTITGTPASDDDGGGIDVDGANARLNLTRSAVVGNVASEQGGGVEVEEGGLVAITNSTISGNRAVGEAVGGAFTAGFGGGVRTFSAATTVTIANSTIAANTAGAAGGGTEQQMGAVTRVKGTLIADNTAPSGPDCNSNPDALTSQGFNLIGNPSTCAFAARVGDRLGLDPELGSLAEHGGPTPTHALLEGSPAIDRGPSDAPRTDQRGAPRRGRPDIGAYERVLCGGEAVTRIGSGRADTLTGTSGADVFLARGGRDRIVGRNGRDGVCAGAGRDKVAAGNGNDEVRAGRGNDSVRGMGGNDILHGQKGADRLWGGAGKDLLDGGRGRDVCHGGPGRNDGRTGSCEANPDAP